MTVDGVKGHYEWNVGLDGGSRSGNQLGVPVQVGGFGLGLK